MYRIKHRHAKSQNMVIGSSVISVDEDGVAEVEKETYDNVAGLKNWIRFLDDGTLEEKEITELKQEVKEEEIILSETELLIAEQKKIIESLKSENESLTVQIEELQSELERLKERVSYGVGQSKEEVDKGFKKAASKQTIVRKRGN